MDPTAAHNDDPKQVHQPNDNSTQLRTLLDDYAAHGLRLRALHEQYLALRDAGLTNEQRREAFLKLLDIELAVLDEAHSIKQALDALLLHPRAGT